MSISEFGISSLADYETLYQESLELPEKFWGRLASRLNWQTPWNEVVSSDFKTIGTTEKPYVSWFAGGKLNVCENCLDRHLTTWRRNKAAIVWRGEHEHERRTLTYLDLHREVCRCAAALTKLGVVAGDRVIIYLPMVPEAVISMLACARIGAVHSLVFSAFSAEALRARIQDCEAKLLITADIAFYGGRIMDLKAKANLALFGCPSIEHTLVLQRGAGQVSMESPRDVWWHDVVVLREDMQNLVPAAFDAETPLFLLYTSGSTGKPKGILHTSGGYLLHANVSFSLYFDHKDEDLYWCTADVGWITGHSYVVYGPLSNGATCFMYEGAPLHPTPDRFWSLIAEHKITTFYTAPTAIRTFMKLGEDHPKRHDLSSLRLLGSVGEPINPEAWKWYHRVIGGERCPIVDTWWQTETGGIMISTIPNIMETKPGAAGRPFFGVNPEIRTPENAVISEEGSGALVLTKPWPGMLRGMYGEANHARIAEVYFSQFPGTYFTGDGAHRDLAHYYWLEGRIDDVLNISAHRLSTAELESALVSHEAVAEAAVVGFPHEIKGQGIYCYVTLKNGFTASSDLEKKLKGQVRQVVGPIATPDKIQFTDILPKTRSGKIMRRLLRKIACGEIDQLGDTSTLAEPSVVQTLLQGRL